MIPIPQGGPRAWALPGGQDDSAPAGHGDVGSGGHGAYRRGPKRPESAGMLTLLIRNICRSPKVVYIIKQNVETVTHIYALVFQIDWQHYLYTVRTRIVLVCPAYSRADGVTRVRSGTHDALKKMPCKS